MLWSYLSIAILINSRYMGLMKCAAYITFLCSFRIKTFRIRTEFCCILIQDPTMQSRLVSNS